MNKYQEAYERLSKRTFKHYKTFDEVFDDIDTLGELVKKETPRKPIEIKYKLLYGWACPHCASCVSNNKKRGHKDIKYCPNCGQRIDFGD